MANICCGVSATGSGSGADWNNVIAASSLSNTGWSRANKYYLRNGTYGYALKYATPVSGTTVIFVVGATAADHGPSIGWSNAIGVDVSPATFTDYNPIDTGYWNIDGNVGSGKVYTAYGFNYTAVSGTQVSIQFGETTNAVLNGIVLKHLGFKAISADVSKTALLCFTQLGAIPGLDVENCCFDGFTNAISCNGTGVGGTNTGWIYKYNYHVNGTSTASFHGEQINANGLALINPLIAFNVFDTCTGTATICANNNNIDCTGGGGVFGNVFIACQSGGNGTVSGTSIGNLVNVPIFNNTFAGCTGGNYVGGSGNSGVTTKNNLVYNQVATYTGQGTADYNAYYNCTSIPTETNGQTTVSNPFTNTSTGDYHLSSDTVLATTFPTGDILDPDSITRTTSRGAYQYLPGGAPTFVSATVASNGTTLTVVVSSTSQNGAGGSGGMKLTTASIDNLATYVSGSVSTIFIYSLATTVFAGQSPLITYAQPGNGIEATSDGTDMSSFSGHTITNNSTQVQAAIGGAYPGARLLALI